MRHLLTIAFLLFAIAANCQLLVTAPSFISDTSTPVQIIADATLGNQGLLNYNPTSDVYVHIGVITNLSTSPSDWRYVLFTWGTTNPAAQCTYLGNNKWSYTITGGLRNFFGITDTAEKIEKIAILFRNGNGDYALRNSDGSDMYIPVYDTSLQVRITQPYSQPLYTPALVPLTKEVGDSLQISAQSDRPAQLTLLFNGQTVASSYNDTISATVKISQSGNQLIKAEASAGSGFSSDSAEFYVAPPTTIDSLPTGVTDGINYEPGDTSVILDLYAPLKHKIVVVGDFNNWQPSAAYQMHETPDSTRFWISITGLTPGKQYAYQYIIDDSIKVADYNTHMILDPANDPGIPATTYPNLMPYPTGKTTGIVSVLQTGQQPYQWQVTNFQRPNEHNLLIYELWVHNFTSAGNWQTLTDTLSYLKRLGINAIEVMPFNEFEGNDSWGYNPIFYFAPDKAYGTPAALKQFIDACHEQGIAVIMDIVLNHSYGESPMVEMYWDNINQRPAADNPWFNQVPTHPDNVGYQFNHESPATKAFTYRVMDYWLTNYHIDGFRFDLAKGFTQKESCDSTGNNCSMAEWDAYDSSRVTIWDTIYNQQQRISPGSYCILEMFSDNSEETVEANYGMMLWGDMNYNFNQATMGYSNGWDLSGGIYTDLGWSEPNLVTYQESHDEERLMFNNEQYGNSSGSYNIKDTTTGLERNAMAAAFWAMIPGPKMLWQFGELGYDYSINTCTNGTIDPTGNCRTDDKPIRWDYYQDANRRALYNVYAKLLDLRDIPDYLSTFTSGNIQYNLTGAVKTLNITSDSLDIVVVGNFDVVSHTGTLNFPSTGTWYEYLKDSTYQVTTASQNINLQPGEYYVFLNRNVDGIENDTTVNTPPSKPDTLGETQLKVFPNPASGSHDLQIDYSIPQGGNVTIQLLDNAGRIVSTLFDADQNSGNYTLSANTSFLTKGSSGAYFLRMITSSKTLVKKLIIIP
jgi:1,4-alpha-glucan branching enzyme